MENHFIKHLRSIKQQIDKQNAHKNELQDEKTQEKILNQDSQKILKIRLKRIIANNKEKLKVLDDYIRKMQNIDEQFGKIKEFSGIQDLNDIADTFIKSDQQNYQLYNYIDSLNQEIDHMREENQSLELRIVQQQVFYIMDFNLKKQIDDVRIDFESTSKEELQQQKIFQKIEER